MNLNGEQPVQLYTVGHSTRSIEELVELLQEHRITCLADVRTVPRSRRNPQFNLENLPGSLNQSGITYIHLPDLGGFRKAQPDSINMAWRNESFRGFADYMQTEKFDQALQHLITLGQDARVAVMCAEAVPWRCHRSLIADALTARDIPVIDILGPGKWQKHVLTSFAKVSESHVSYPVEE